MPPFLIRLLGFIKCNDSYELLDLAQSRCSVKVSWHLFLFGFLLWTALGVKSSKKRSSREPDLFLYSISSPTAPAKFTWNPGATEQEGTICHPNQVLPILQMGKPRLRAKTCIESVQWCVCLLQTGLTITTKKIQAIQEMHYSVNGLKAPLSASDSNADFKNTARNANTIRLDPPETFWRNNPLELRGWRRKEENRCFKWL